MFLRWARMMQYNRTAGSKFYLIDNSTSLFYPLRSNQLASQRLIGTIVFINDCKVVNHAIYFCICVTQTVEMRRIFKYCVFWFVPKANTTDTVHRRPAGIKSRWIMLVCFSVARCNPLSEMLTTELVIHLNQFFSPLWHLWHYGIQPQLFL